MVPPRDKVIGQSVKEYMEFAVHIQDSMMDFAKNGFTMADLKAVGIVPSLYEWRARDKAVKSLKTRPPVQHKPFEQLVKEQAYARVANALSHLASQKEEELLALEEIEELVETETRAAKIGWGEW